MFLNENLIQHFWYCTVFVTFILKLLAFSFLFKQKDQDPVEDPYKTFTDSDPRAKNYGSGGSKYSYVYRTPLYKVRLSCNENGPN
jgi:hypothetical protein